MDSEEYTRDGVRYRQTAEGYKPYYTFWQKVGMVLSELKYRISQVDWEKLTGIIISLGLLFLVILSLSELIWGV
jgi:hypothetical protein